ncbi:torsin-1A-like [Triplophysa dalaica]|uniref:torsin-1A-like n=1 Tax=Triplophysa dalaica TaxID=1582913 RepID=UPI0024DF9747|nr:torsin-1A-like [Triplophysa dalaica]XP_056607647.1 torsin-1A-like [Triplophysa dalaica]
MKASYFVTVLLLSDITLTSGFIIESIVCGSAAAVAAFLYALSQRDNVLPFDHKRLEKDLNENLHGQHIVSKVVLRTVSSFMTDSNPNKPLVLSFHGTAGVGKNHVSKIIARNIYKLGDKSEHFIMFVSQHHFPHKDKVDMYSARLKEQIHQHVSRFPRTMFVFDEMDKMNPRLVETIKPFLDYGTHVDGVSFRSAIFIFLSNAGGDVINNIALDFWKAGKNREELQMKEMENQILQNIVNDKSTGGFWHSSLINHHLVDHIVPFLPLEMKHVRQCVLTEMVNLNINLQHHAHLADTVARDMPFFPSDKIFSVKGCKSVRQKLMLYVDD